MVAYRIKSQTLRMVISRKIDVILLIWSVGIVIFYLYDWQFLRTVIAIPFVLCYSNKFMYNIINVFALIFIWFFVNIIRIWILVEFTSRNYNWWISHHIPYMILYYGTLLIVVGTWSKNRIRIKFIKKREHKTITSLSI